MQEKSWPKSCNNVKSGLTAYYSICLDTIIRFIQIGINAIIRAFKTLAKETLANIVRLV